MEYRKLGCTDIDVSAICLGTMTWGEQNTPAEAFEQLNYAVTAGINFIDTAELYPVPPTAKTYSDTETILGQWLATQGQREKLVLATKAAGPGEWVSYIRGGPRLSRTHLNQAVESSLKRLQTDYIDLYQLHWPDRSTNFFGRLGYEQQIEEDSTPLEETLDTLQELVKAGKIRSYGLSNETPWGTMSSIQLARQRNWPVPVSIQNPYNLLNRTFEVGLAEIAHRENIGLLAYSPMAFGTLSGKYLNNAQPPSARLTLYKRFQRYNSPQSLTAISDYVELAHKHQLNPAQMALSYVTSRPFTTSTIIGATTMEQLKTNIDSINIKLDDQLRTEIDAIHQRHPNPAP